MQFTRSFLLALASALTTLAQDGPNAFNTPEDGGFQATAGEPLTLTWNPTTEGTVSLILRSGAASDLAEGTPIAENIPNSGSYTWTPDPNTTRGSDYTVQIVDDANPSEVNYTPFFVLESDNTVASSTGIISTGAPSSSLELSTATPTASPSMFPTTNMPTTSDSSMTTDSSDSMTSTSSGTNTMSTRASSTSNGDLQASSTSSEGSAARATAMVGMLGAVALGALAL